MRPIRLAVLLALACAACAASIGSPESGADCEGGKCDSVADVSPPECDPADDDLTGFEPEIIIVGSGAGGGPLAANLANAGKRVLVLEAGVDTGCALEYRVPSFNLLASEKPDMSWAFYVKHYDNPADESPDKLVTLPDGRQGIFYPRGSTLGGSAAVNALITVTPHDSDWQGIADLTGDQDGWSPSRMRAYFDNLVRHRILFHTRGWLSTEMHAPLAFLFDPYLGKILTGAALEAEGIWSGLVDLITRRDVNSPSRDDDGGEGVYGVPLVTFHGSRNGPRDFLLRVRRNHPDLLKIKTGALATRVLFAGEPDADGNCDQACRTAVGVEVMAGRSLYGADRGADLGAPAPSAERLMVAPGGEVILSAGAFNTPQLLKLSGIGPRSELASLDIPLRTELPVGTNLQDRYEVGVVFALSQGGDDLGNGASPVGFPALGGCSFNPANRDEGCLRDWLGGGGGILSSSELGIIKRSSVAVGDPDLFVFGGPVYFRGYYPQYSRDAFGGKNADQSLWTWAVLKAHTRNQAGSVTLRSADPREPPDIHFRYFAQGGAEDLQAVADGVELARRLAARADGELPSGTHLREIWPGASVVGDDLNRWIQKETWGHHACCTAAIGQVLDGRFQVLGTSHLRVVDASVFPSIPGFFIVVPTYMVSERAADLIVNGQ